MTTAILEIVGMLTVSCLIGIFFTYRYWKVKVDDYSTKLQLAQNDASTALKKVQESQDAMEKANIKISDLTKELDKAKNKKTGYKRSKEDDALIDDLKLEVERLIEQMNEKERELENVSNELAAKKISYYKQIDGKRYKAVTLKMADESVSGKGDGRISIEDAQRIFDTISDGKAYTQVEKDTMRYIRDNYHWTDGADALFRKKVRSWAAKHHELED